MAEHPIQGLMSTAMESIRDMVDVNTIVGDAVQAPDGTVIIPISKVSFGFAAGGGEYSQKADNEDENEDPAKQASSKFPFAGGSGGGVSIQPVAFMVVGQEQIKLLPINMNTSLDKILDLVPDLISKANEAIKKKIVIRQEIKNGDTTSKSRKEIEEE